MFPHQMLDWNLSRLEKRLEASADDAAARAELAKAALSKAHFHGGGEVWYNRALTEARRVIQAEPDHAEALVVAGISLVALERLEASARYLDEAMRVAGDQAIVHYGTSLLLDANRDRSGAIRAMELACRIAPESWEVHAALGGLLHEESQAAAGAGRRLVERAQFHLVRALQLEPAPAARARLIRDLGVSCLKNGRVEEALRLFQQLLDNDKYKAQAHYLLGLAMLEQGRHKNAILHLRQHLAAPPTGGRPGMQDHPNVYARIGLAYLELHEPAKAREQVSLALAAEPGHVLARYVLARAAIADGQIDEGARILRDLLEDAPDHAGAFRSVVQIRADNQDLRWLRQALRSETAVFDRLPVSARRDEGGGHVSRVAPREATRTRIGIIIEALDRLDNDAARTLLECMDLTTDEGLRFRLWEAALGHCARRQAEGIGARLSEPGRYYGAALARAALQVADRLDETALVRSLNLSEDDLRRAAVDRYGPVQDLAVHRQNIERERQEARAWQALILLSVGVHRTRSGRNLLLRWATDADPDLADSARTALTLAGDSEAVAALRARAEQRGAEGLVDQLQALLAPIPQPQRPRPVVSTPRGPVPSPLVSDYAGSEAAQATNLDAACSTCGRRSPEVEHTLVGEGASVCNHCMAAIARDRRALRSDDPTRGCALCHNTVLTSRAVYVYRGVVVCADCVDDSLGLQEREVVARFLAAV